MRKSVLFSLFVLMAASVCAQASYTMPSSGTNTITACSGVVLDPGGTGNYPSNCNSYLIINPATPGSKVRLTGTYNMESGYDYFRVYDGTTTSGTQLGEFQGTGTCDVFSLSGPLLIYFHSDGSVQYSGFELEISCIDYDFYTMSSSSSTITTCNAVVFDNGGPTGNYSSYSDNTLIVYPATSGCSVMLTGSYNTESVTYDYIKVYNGAGASGTPLATLGGEGSITTPLVSSAPSGALTIVFHSDGSVQKSGFELMANCLCDIDTTCAGSHYQSYGLDTIFTTTGLHYVAGTGQDGTSVMVGVYVLSKIDVSITGEHYFCGDESITLTSNNAVSYLWNTGATTQSISVQNTGNYSVTITDIRGCSASATHKIVPIEEFITSINFPIMCAGNDYPVFGSYNSGSEIEMFHVQSTLSVADTAFLPDGVPCDPYGCSYRSTLTFTDYDEDAVVETVDDIYYVKINLEHSFIGDIYINITCPNGQKADIMRWAGSGSSSCSSLISASSRGWQSGSNTSGGTFFGRAYDYGAFDKCDKTASANAPGTGWNYCWSNNTSQGYTYAADGGLVYRSANVHYNSTVSNNIVDSSNVAAGTKFYHPDESFASLVGCPLNGSWYIEVIDGYSQDNGYIFGWELALTDEYTTQNTFSVSSITPEAPWTTVVSDTSFIISPPADLERDTTVNCILHFYNSEGCSYDSVVPVTVIAAYHADTTVSACESFFWHETDYAQSGDYTLSYTSTAGCDSTLTLHLTVNHNVQNSDTLELVENQLPYYFAPADTTFPIGSPAHSQFSYILPTQQQCDSLIVQTVLIHANTFHSYDTTVCSSDMPFTWHGHTFTEMGDFTDTLLSANGSDSVVYYHLDVDLLQAVPNNVTMVTCDGGSDGGAGALADLGQLPYTYLWTNSAGAVVSSAMQMNNVPVGTYVFSVTDALGCVSSDSVIIQATFPPMDAGTISGSQSVCIGGDLQPFTGTEAAGHSQIDYQWQISYDGADWQPAPGSNSSLGYTYPLVPEETFFLRRKMSCYCGTANSEVLTVSVFSSYIDSVTVLVCQGETVEYEGFEIPEEYFETPGDYYLEYSYSSGLCDSVLVLHLKVNPIYEQQLQASLCEGAGYFANGFHIQGYGTVGLESLDSILVFQTAAGCDSVVRLHLDFVDTTLRIISRTEDFCDGMTAELMVVTQFADYVWNTGEQSPNIIVTDPGVYSVTAEQDGCRVTSHIQIEECALQVNLPNAITPSKGDGLNDHFSIPEDVAQRINNFEIRIFSRWGEQVFYSTDKNFRWNGEISGKIAVGSVFIYIIHYTDTNGKPVTLKGFITVL